MKISSRSMQRHSLKQVSTKAMYSSISSCSNPRIFMSTQASLPPICAEKHTPHTPNADTPYSPQITLAKTRKTGSRMASAKLLSRLKSRPGGASTASLGSRRRAGRISGDILKERNTRNPQATLGSRAVASFCKPRSL